MTCKQTHSPGTLEGSYSDQSVYPLNMSSNSSLQLVFLLVCPVTLDEAWILRDQSTWTHQSTLLNTHLKKWTINPIQSAIGSINAKDDRDFSGAVHAAKSVKSGKFFISLHYYVFQERLLKFNLNHKTASSL